MKKSLFFISAGLMLGLVHNAQSEQRNWAKGWSNDTSTSNVENKNTYIPRKKVISIDRAIKNNPQNSNRKNWSSWAISGKKAKTVDSSGKRFKFFVVGEGVNAKMQMLPYSDRLIVKNKTGKPAGTVVVDSSKHKLYYTLKNGKAISYGIGVGRDGFRWSGYNRITRKEKWPSWTPPEQMRKRVPDLPRFMEGGIDNPLGARALYLGNTLFRIHGTNNHASIGYNVSSGCIRMHNDDVSHLYNMVKTGTPVYVLK